MDFLTDLTPRPVQLPPGQRFTVKGLHLGQGSGGLEVMVVNAPAEPPAGEVRSLWKHRNGGRAAPLLVVVLYGQGEGARALVCGPQGDEPTVYRDADVKQVERICRLALKEPSRFAALRNLRDTLPSLEHQLPGLRNEGFLAQHELVHGAPKLPVWREATAKAKPVLGKEGESLLAALGFTMQPADNLTKLLAVGPSGKKVAVAALLTQEEGPELTCERFGGLSPVAYALTVADRENLPYVVVVQGTRLRLYPTRLGVGVGRRGRSETFVSVDTALLRDAEAAYLWLLFSSEALVESGTLSELIQESSRFAADLAVRLRERIYEYAVPALAEGIAAARKLKKPSAADLAQTYEMAMTVLFRLLFIAYAEDKDLLPYKHNGAYRDHSLKKLALEVRDARLAGHASGGNTTRWPLVKSLFRAVDKGNASWGVCAYNGGLFTSDAAVSPLGAEIDALELPDAVVDELIFHTLITEMPEGNPDDPKWGPVDFRSLGVREFGTVYEGLLEQELSVAEEALTTDAEGFYRPVTKKTDVVQVKEGRIYLHNRSGARKSSGSYYTKHFAVEHLLDQALEPAMDDHLARVDKLDDDKAAERFFDFRVADIAMGSGHFLVAAVDRIERRFTRYLAERRNLPGVRGELGALRAAAQNSLGVLADQIEIEDTQLLRRLIARRCIYGVDINPVSVNLARLSIWIHTFVPGLPLGLLDHNLVVGNSLVGMATVQELKEFAEQGEATRPLFKMDVQSLVGVALVPLKRLANAADVTPAEVAKMRKDLAEARASVRPAEALFDIATARRIEGKELDLDLSQWGKTGPSLRESKIHKDAKKTLGRIEPFHFPVAFPEVFLRDRPGFDVILGNPPWQEATVEEAAFFGRHVPGLRGFAQREQEAAKAKIKKARPDLVRELERETEDAEHLRRALVKGPYPGMGTGDPDLYKAFCWRFWQLVCQQGGRLGIVLPRSVWSAQGSAPFRRTVFDFANPIDLTFLTNSGGWVFDEAERRYTIGVCVIGRTGGKPTLRLRGPFSSMERYRVGVLRPPAVFPGADASTWNDAAALPLLPGDDSPELFSRLRASPRLDLDDGTSWRARPHTELHATNDKRLMDLKSVEKPKGYWPVMKGESFDLWLPDTGKYYAWADPEEVVARLHSKAQRGANLSSSPFSEFKPFPFTKPESLPCYSPRIAFRDVARSTDSRTVKIGLLPPKVFITNKGPYLLFPRGTSEDQAYVLGVLGSLPLDWYARRFVEVNLNFHILNPFPVPRPPMDDSLKKVVVRTAARLSAVDKRLAKWAEQVGVEYASLTETERFELLCRLDAAVALLYGLEERHLLHVFETFHEGWGPGKTADHYTLGNYDARLAETLKEYRELRDEHGLREPGTCKVLRGGKR